MCNALLVRNRGPPPNDSVEHQESHAGWVITPYGNSLYTIEQGFGCPPTQRCELELFFHNATGVPSAIRGLWGIEPRGDGYRIRSHWGCPNDPLCRADLSWDYSGSYEGIATVNSVDSVDWTVTKVQSRLTFLLSGKWYYFFLNLNV